MLVLGDFGRGKTFALREVARRLPTAAPDLIPILVELRALDKAHSVDGLVAAHLATPPAVLGSFLAIAGPVVGMERMRGIGVHDDF